MTLTLTIVLINDKCWTMTPINDTDTDTDTERVSSSSSLTNGATQVHSQTGLLQVRELRVRGYRYHVSRGVQAPPMCAESCQQLAQHSVAA